MTGNQMIAAFNSATSNDLYPLLAGDDGTVNQDVLLSMLNIVAQKVMRRIGLRVYDIPLYYIDGQTRYSLLSLSIPISEVETLIVNDRSIFKSERPDEKGWCQVYQSIDIFYDASSSDNILVSGFQGAAPIAASDSEITDIPQEIHLAIVYLTLVENCVAHEDSPNQLVRLQRMKAQAEEIIFHCTSRAASVQMRRVSGRS